MKQLFSLLFLAVALPGAAQQYAVPAAPKTGTYEQNISRAKAAIKANDQYQARQYLKWAYEDNAQGLEVNNLLGKVAERDNEPEKAEKYYSVCARLAPTDTVFLEQHGRLALACLQLHPTAPNLRYQEPDYLALAVNDYSALIAANHQRYLLARAVAYTSRAKFTAKPGGEESTKLYELAWRDLEQYELLFGRSSKSDKLRQSLPAVTARK